jgi:hypothetical protein
VCFVCFVHCLSYVSIVCLCIYSFVLFVCAFVRLCAVFCAFVHLCAVCRCICSFVSIVCLCICSFVCCLSVQTLFVHCVLVVCLFVCLCVVCLFVCCLSIWVLSVSICVLFACVSIVYALFICCRCLSVHVLRDVIFSLTNSDLTTKLSPTPKKPSQRRDCPCALKMTVYTSGGAGTLRWSILFD